MPTGHQEAGGTLEVTHAVTRRAPDAAGGLGRLITESTLREPHRLNLYTGADLPDTAHNKEPLT